MSEDMSICISGSQPYCFVCVQNLFEVVSFPLLILCFLSLCPLPPDIQVLISKSSPTSNVQRASTVKFTFSFLSNFLEYLAFANVIILTPISHSLITRKSYLALLEYYCHCQVDHVNHVKSNTKTMMITTTTTMMR